MVEDRINWIDMAKGYGILGVIIGHISTPGITVWIYTFHIPLFFFMSGFLFNTNYSLVVFLNRKIKALLIPYFCLAILIVFHELLFNRGFCWGGIELYEEIVKVIVQERYSPLWFIASLFWANFLYYIINKIIEGYLIKTVLVIILLSFSIIFWKSGGCSMPWNIDITFFILPFILIGNYLHANKGLYELIISRRWVMFLFLIGNVAIGGVNYHLTGRKIDLFFADVDIIPLTYLSAFLGIFFLIIVSHVKTYRIICYIGRNSLLIFAWHLIVYNWLGRLYDYLGIFQTPLPLYMIIVRDFMSLFLILLILIPINEMILHSRFKFVLGRG